jgi:D-alanine--poly(phosphoribitol) ligase subunit 2
MTDPELIIPRLAALFSDQFHIEVSADTDLLENGILDSLQLVQLLVEIEIHFHRRIDIEEIDLDDLRTLEGIASLIARNARPRDRDGVPASRPA